MRKEKNKSTKHRKRISNKTVVFLIVVLLTICLVFSITYFSFVRPVCNLETWLLFAGSVLTFLGTLFLGGVSIYQNFNLNRINEKLLLGEGGYLDLIEITLAGNNLFQIRFNNIKNVVIISYDQLKVYINHIEVMANTDGFSHPMGINSGLVALCPLPEDIKLEENLYLEFIVTYYTESENGIRIFSNITYNATYRNKQLCDQRKKHTRTIFNY